MQSIIKMVSVPVKQTPFLKEHQKELFFISIVNLVKGINYHFLSDFPWHQSHLILGGLKNQGHNRMRQARCFSRFAIDP